MKKISLKSISEALTRDEMRIIKGGSGSVPGCCRLFCNLTTECFKWCNLTACPSTCTSGICV